MEDANVLTSRIVLMLEKIVIRGVEDGFCTCLTLVHQNFSHFLKNQVRSFEVILKLRVR